MQKILITTVVALLAFTTATVQAKDKHKSKKHHGNGHARSSYVQSSQYRGSSYSYSSNYRDGYDNRDYGRSHRDHTRTIYLIQNDRPVRQVVYVDDGGRYYRRDGDRRRYISSHYFESYPSRYYTSSGQRRINITLPF